MSSGMPNNRQHPIPTRKQFSLDAENSSRTFFVSGLNFSGRTDFLKLFLSKEERKSFVGLEVYFSLSSLASTVQEELSLQSHGLDSSTYHEFLTQKLKLPHILCKDPFSLSGGEQTCLALCSGLAASSNKLAVDCALEQLDESRRFAFLNEFKRLECLGLQVAIADNRATEWLQGIQIPIVRVPHVENHRAPFHRMDSNVRFPGPESLCREISLNEVAIRYRGASTDLLKDVSFSLSPGEIYHLQGANGAGKTTLAKLLAGDLKPRCGQISSNGVIQKPWKRPGHTFSYHSQNPDVQLFFNSVRQEIQASPSCVHTNTGLQERLFNSAICAFSLQTLLNANPFDLPFAMRKRVALAATLAAGTPWIILDEPSLGQDDQEVHTLVRILKNLAAQGTGIIVISHSNSFTIQLNARRLSISGGTVLSEDC